LKIILDNPKMVYSIRHKYSFMHVTFDSFKMRRNNLIINLIKFIIVINVD